MEARDGRLRVDHVRANALSACQPLDHEQIRAVLRMNVVANLIHERTDQKNSKPGDTGFLEVHVAIR